jgi:GH15 family glucan-1,4-alpha-glucosidase
VNRNLELGLVGNSSFSALVDADTNVVWSCFPRFDSDPVFDALLKGADDPEDGIYRVELFDRSRIEQAYVDNTAVLRTRLHDARDGSVEVIDFAPRFKQFGRTFRPLTLVRLVRPIAGRPRVRIRLRPTSAVSGVPPVVTHGSNHIRYVLPHVTLRLTTDASITALLDETPFVVDRPVTLILGPDETFQSGVAETGRYFLEETISYWQEWVRYLGIPFEWQDAVIRAAITLKLNSFDDTGAIVAAMTTSIPEAPGTVRTWDYRYCWLRDAEFVVSALSRLGVTKTMESYLGFIVNVVAGSDGGRLQPVYGINGATRLVERIVEGLDGYRGMGPVRFGNQAYEQIQNDVYGAAILAATQMFFDRRLASPGDESLYRRLEQMGALAVEVFADPDAGPWEIRGTRRVHTYSAVMCWAACDRLSRIGRRLGLEERALDWSRQAEKMHGTIEEGAFNRELGSFTGSFGGNDLDAALLLLPRLGFLSASDARFVGTVAAAERYLLKGDYLFRYTTADDFGYPETAFLVCSFWYVDALHALGRVDEARTLFEKLLARRNRLGLLSEDVHPGTGELWGNFPQTYSMVGLIDSARKLSKPWELGY